MDSRKQSNRQSQFTFQNTRKSSEAAAVTAGQVLSTALEPKEKKEKKEKKGKDE